MGDADTPAGGSVCMRLKSRINRRRAEVDMSWGGFGGWSFVVALTRLRYLLEDQYLQALREVYLGRVRCRGYSLCLGDDGN